MEPLRALINLPIHQESLNRLQQLDGVHVELAPELGTDGDLPPDQLGNADVLLTTPLPTNHTIANSLNFMQLGSVGYTQLGGARLPQRGVTVANSRGVFDTAIGAWNIAMMINLARDLRGMIANQDRQIWDRDARFQRDIWGAHVGIFGYGGIGRETARLCKTMGMYVSVLTRSPVGPRTDVYTVPGTGDPDGTLPDQRFSPDQQSAFLAELDFLVVAVPQTAETNGIIGADQLRALPDHAFVLNPARGPIIDENALIAAVENGWIRGAALDTHYAYPLPQDHPLWRFPNVILTPHISGSTRSNYYLERVWNIFVDNVARLQTGQPLLNVVSPLQLDMEVVSI